MKTLDKIKKLLPFYSDENTKPPSEVKHNDAALRIWCCDKGHKWKESVNSRVVRLKDEKYEADCLYCKHRAVYGSPFLGKNRPDLIELWDYSKNTVDPMTLKVMDTDIDLKCKKNSSHRYTLKASALIRGQRCTICASKVVNESNCLATTNPEMAKQWDYEANAHLKNKQGNTLTPHNITAGCNRYVNWACVEYGHKWNAKISTRTKDEKMRTGDATGCPTCAGKIALLGFNTLFDTHPEMAKEWDYETNASLFDRHGKIITPKTITAGCNKKVNWVCKINHKWKTAINSRTNNNAECSRCSLGQFSRQEMRLYAEILTVYPDTEWSVKPIHIEGLDGRSQPKVDIFIPSLKLVIEFDGYYNHKSDKSWQTDLAKNKILTTNGFTVIRIRPTPLKPTSDNDISPTLKQDQLNIDTMKRLVEKIAETVPSEKDRAEVQRYLDANEFLNTGKYKQLLSKNGLPRGGQSLAVKDPVIAARWDYEKNHPITPDMVTASSPSEYYFICENGIHSRYQKIGNLTIGKQTKCLECLGKVTNDETSLASVYPVVAKEWHRTKNGSLTPYTVHSGAALKAWWQCSKEYCQHEWKTFVFNRTKKGSGCPACSGNIITNKNCLMATHPHIAKMWDEEKNKIEYPNKTVFNISASSSLKANLICSHCDGPFQKAVGNLIRRNEKCPNCKKRFS